MIEVTTGAPEQREGPESQVMPSVPAVLPVLPLRDIVAFPNTMTPLAVGQERSVQLVNDVSADPRYVQPTGAVRVRAELAVPIVLGEHVLGVLNVESDQARALR